MPDLTLTPRDVLEVKPYFTISKLCMVMGTDGEAEREDAFLDGRYETLDDALAFVAAQKYGYWFVDRQPRGGTMFPAFMGDPEKARKLIESKAV